MTRPPATAAPAAPACRPRHPGRLAAVALATTLASLARAQEPAAGGGSCEQFRERLAARIEAQGVRGHSLEIVPGTAPLAPGARVVGTCQGGARKIVYRRFAAPPSAGAGAAPAVAAAPAPPPAAPRLAPAAPAPPPPAPPPAPAPPAPAPPAPPPPPPPAPAPPQPAPAAAPAIAVAANLPPTAAPAPPPAAPSPRVADEPVIAAAPAAPRPVEPGRAATAASWLQARAAWLWALVPLALGGLWWLWRTRWSPYDEAGLPRGPRIRA